MNFACRLSTFVVALAAAAAASAVPTVLGWSTPPAVKMTVHQKSIFAPEVTYTVSRKGTSLRIEGTFPVYGAFSKVPHVELYSDSGYFLFVPSLNAALQELSPRGIQRANVTYAAKIQKDLFQAPKDLLTKELKQPARVEGEEKVAGRDCYVLSTADPKDAGSKLKRWIDEVYGIALKSQQTRNGKTEFEFETTEVAFADLPDPATFAVPKDAKLLTGSLSPAALEKLTELGDQAKYEAAMKAAASQAKQLDPPWAGAITAPAGLGHALTTYRSGLAAVFGGQGGSGAGGAGGPKTVTLPEGSVMFQSSGTDENGNFFQVVAITKDDTGGAAVYGPVQIQMKIEGSQATISGTGDKDVVIPLPPKGSSGQGQRTQPGGPNGVVMQPSQGVFVSEFVDASTGHTLVFYQSKDIDPLVSLGPRASLGQEDKVLIGSTQGTAYHSDLPFARDVVTWKQANVWCVLSASGIPRDELVKAAASLHSP